MVSIHRSEGRFGPGGRQRSSVIHAATTLPLASTDSGHLILGGPPGPLEESAVGRANDQADRELGICKQEDDQIVKQGGSQAPGAHLEDCIGQYANSRQVEPQF